MQRRTLRAAVGDGAGWIVPAVAAERAGGVFRTGHDDQEDADHEGRQQEGQDTQGHECQRLIPK